MTSPSVDTVGATRLSMSQSRRTAPTDSSTVAARTMKLASRPPRIDTRARSMMPMAFSMPKPTAVIRATTARISERMNVSDSDAATFWPSTVSRRNDEAEGTGVDRGRDPVAEGAEDVAAAARWPPEP